jgi:hypothetical protein
VRAIGPGLSVFAHVDDDGRYVFAGLPDVPLRLEASARVDKRTIEQKASATAGSTVDFDLRK